MIEDETALREEISDRLMFEGYDVFQAEDGLSGVAAVMKYTPDLVVCDMAMPGLDGLGVLHAMRSNPVTESMPFIFLTANVLPEVIQQADQLGVSGYIFKPFTFSDLFFAIKRAL